MEHEAQAKILQLLDVISVEVAANRSDTAALRAEMHSEVGGLRTEMRSGFDRVERRLGHLEIRVEVIETEVRDFRGEFERRIAPLER